MVRAQGPPDPFSTVGLNGTQRNIPSFIRSAGGVGVSSSSGASDFSGRTMNTGMLVSSSARNESYAGTSSGQPQHPTKWINFNHSSQDSAVLSFACQFVNSTNESEALSTSKTFLNPHSSLISSNHHSLSSTNCVAWEPSKTIQQWSIDHWIRLKFVVIYFIRASFSWLPSIVDSLSILDH